MGRCLCKVGPGKYEGEGPETWLLHQHVMNEGADAELPSEDGGSYHALVKGPFVLVEADAMAALEAGYCVECLALAKIEIETADQAILTIDTDGFISTAFGVEEDIQPEWDVLTGDYYLEDDGEEVVEDEE